MEDPIKAWSEFFNKVFIQTKKILSEHYPLEEDGSGPPHIVALRKAVDSLPFAIKLVELRIDVEKHPDIEDNLCQLMMYDFSRLGNLVVESCSNLDVDDKEGITKVLIEGFGLDKADADNFIKEFYPDLKIVGYWDPDHYPDFYIAFTSRDIRKNAEEFIYQFATDFSFHFGDIIARKFEVKVDYTALYNLKPDPVVSLEELLKREIDYPSGTIENIQKHVVDLQLIPSVPEAVQRVFKNAKDLYIFGYFRYKFFTISYHYAYLALESAIKNRYYQSLGEEVILRNRKGVEARMRKPDHQRIIDFCRANSKLGWKASEVFVNGKKFAYNKEELLQWLVDERIITRWEKRLCEYGLRLRDILSHQTFAPIHLPSYAHSALVEVANLINKMYSAQAE